MKRIITIVVESLFLLLFFSSTCLADILPPGGGWGWGPRIQPVPAPSFGGSTWNMPTPEVVPAVPERLPEKEAGSKAENEQQPVADNSSQSPNGLDGQSRTALTMPHSADMGFVFAFLVLIAVASGFVIRKTVRTVSN